MQAVAYLRRWFALLELLVTVSIITVLASLLLPALQRAQGEAQRISCTGNLRQLSTAMLMYANDHRGKLPPYVTGAAATDHPGTNWANWCRPYYEALSLLLCPATNGKLPGDTPTELHLYDGSYAWNYEGTQGNHGPLSAVIRQTANVYLLMDSGDQCIIYGGNNWDNLMEELDLDWDSGAEGCNRHRNRVNTAFVDGHCESRTLWNFLSVPCKNKEPPWHIVWQGGELPAGIIPFPER